MAPPRILFVDDEPDIVTPVKFALERNNFVVGGFTNPKEDLSKFESGKYDLALMNVRMPEMNGMELSQKIRKQDPTLKICFLTAYEQLQDGLSRESSPEFYFLRKPISISVLTKELREIVAEEK